MPTKPPTYEQRLRAKHGGFTASDEYERRRMADPRLARARRLRSSSRYRHKFRPWFLARHPLCELCKASGRYVPTAHLHHTRGLAEYPDDLCDEARCQALCSTCHMAIEGTARGQTNQARVSGAPTLDVGSSETVAAGAETVKLTHCTVGSEVHEVISEGISPIKTPSVGSNPRSET